MKRFALAHAAAAFPASDHLDKCSNVKVLLSFAQTP
jgi:hypothetical protein